VAAISLGGIWLIAPRSVLRRFDWHMFFLGAAFALLEVKALIVFALLSAAPGSSTRSSSSPFSRAS